MNIDASFLRPDYESDRYKNLRYKNLRYKNLKASSSTQRHTQTSLTGGAFLCRELAPLHISPHQ